MTEDLKSQLDYFKDEPKYLRNVIAELEQESKELKEENIEVKKEFNNLIAEIISDIEYTGEITCNGESPKEHLKKCQKALKALEEIRKIAEDAKEYRYAIKSEDYADGMHTIGCYILNKINEVLGND